MLQGDLEIDSSPISESILNIIDTIVIRILQDSDNYPIYIQMRALWVLKKQRIILTEKEQHDKVYGVAGRYFLEAENLAIKLTA